MVKTIVKCFSPHVATTTETSDFDSLVNRIDLLDKIARKLP